MSFVFVDFETKSEAELRGSLSVGLHNYVADSTTKPLMLAWALDDGPVNLWEPRLSEMSAELFAALHNPRVQIVAFNSAFERGIFQHCLNITIPANRFADPQPSARYLSLPGDLDEVGKILGLPLDMAKDKEGKRLIDLFCKPHKTKKKKGEEQQTYFPDHLTNPEDWQKFCEYCKQDVIAEREVLRRLTLLGVFPLPPLEREIWLFDQKVNDRGIPVNVEFVQKALKLAQREKTEAIENQNKLTGLENANSNSQMLAWVKTQGYAPNELRKEAVAAELKFSTELTPVCREVLTARKAASSTSYKKLATILRQVSFDHRLRNSFIYMGSSRCGRWTSGSTQLHNMARPEPRFEDEEVLDKARKMIFAEDYEGIKKEFDSVLLTVKSCLRTAFEVNPAQRFNVADLNAIETRVGAWIAGCTSLLQVFVDGKDPYLDFAVKLVQIPYETLATDLKSKDSVKKAAAKGHRQFAKPGVLGAIYRLSGGRMGMKKGYPAKLGLWGYAENMGITMTLEQANEIVRVFRESYPEIPKMWFAFEDAIKNVLLRNKKVELGPEGCIKFDRIDIKDRSPILRIQLPSGRYLHYVDARYEDYLKPWKDEDGNDVYGPTFTYSSQNQTTHQWETVASHGGKTYENCTQAIARDVLAVKLLEFEKTGIAVCGHVHDEGISETPNDPFYPGVEDMIQIMSQPINWAPALPLGADGFQSAYYHK